MKILVISDIHANLGALEAVLAAERLSCAGLLCLGDCVGYGPDPEECVRLLRSLGEIFNPCCVLSGNHDAALSGLVPLEWFNQNARDSVLRARLALSAESREWLSSLEGSMDLSARIPGISALAVHGSPLEPLTGYLFGTDETAYALLALADRGIGLCFCGHTHEAAFFSSEWRLSARYPGSGETFGVSPKKRGRQSRPIIVNPGSVGFPRALHGTGSARDSVDLASYPARYAVWDTDAQTVSFRDARYDRRPLEARLSE